MKLIFAQILKEKSKLLIILISFLGASIYFQTYNFQYSLDDEIYAIKNSATKEGVNSISDIFKYGSLYFYEENSLNEGIYRPVTLLSFSIEKSIFNEFNASNGHIFNIFLYFITLLLIGFLLLKILPKNLPSYIALFILALYAFHPIHTEVVASVKSRDILLSSVFSFSAIYYWVLNYQKLKIYHYFIIFLLFLLSLLSKEESLTIIAVVFLIAYFFLAQTITKSIKHTLPFIISGCIYLMLRFIILDSPTPGLQSILNNVLYTAHGEQRIATNLFVYITYIKLLLFPHPLSWDYSFSHIVLKSFKNTSVIFSLVFFSSLFYIALKEFRKKSILSFGILFYLVTFSIFANLTPSITIGSNLAERFLFIPSLGFCILIVYSIYFLSTKVKIVKPQTLTFGFILLIAIAYFSKSYSRTAVWENNLTLTSADIENSINSWRSNMKYAENCNFFADQISRSKDTSNIYLKKADSLYRLAAKHYQKAYNITGYKKELKNNLSRLGECYLKIGDTVNAEKIFLIGAKYPKLYKPLINLGVINSNKKKYSEAINYYTKALNAENPNLLDVYKNLGNIYIELNDYIKSIEYFEKALEHGQDTVIKKNLFLLYSRTGNIEKVTQLEKYDTLISSEERNFNKLINIGYANFENKNYPEVIKILSSIKSDYTKFGGIKKHPKFLEKLGTSYFFTNDYKKAKYIFSEITNEDKNIYMVNMYLGFIAYQSDKNVSKAIYYFEQCLTSKSPDLFNTYKNLGGLYMLNNEKIKAIESYENALTYGSDDEVLKNLKKLKE
ncbi:tetratricopeptide repeat protein [Lutibacter sp.]|uniref:tetratricopeptide repeat protein n=1 Tax=Lutibacter sp. TaxID=1925666 RepID=UPI003567CEE0